MTTKIPRGRRSGTLETRTYAGGRVAYFGRLRLADGSKSGRMPAPDGMTHEQAARWLAGQQAREDAEHIVYTAKVEAAREVAASRGEAHQGETVDAWYGRFSAVRECGEGHRRVSLASWAKWVSPAVGKRAIARLTRDDLEDVRDSLDRAVSDGRIRSATARNVWATVTAAMKAAYAAKDRSLRVHASPLHIGILPTRHGAPRARPWLYPSEWARLVACEEIPREWRFTYAVALYTGLRPNELRALTWNDVDLDARLVHVSKAWDPEAREVKAPKTSEGTRSVPIRPELAAILRPPASRGAPVAPIPWGRMAERFRADLRTANVLRARLFASTDAEEAIDFRSLRDSYATWSALSGVDPLTLRRELGHRDLSTTDRYVKAAATVRLASIGAPFPPLPLGPSEPCGPRFGPSVPQVRGTLVGAAGFEPATSTV